MATEVRLSGPTQGNEVEGSSAAAGELVSKSPRPYASQVTTCWPSVRIPAKLNTQIGP